jgi:hypothetical protein
MTLVLATIKFLKIILLLELPVMYLNRKVEITL